MFILLQLPLADLRPLIKGGRGRLEKPDWTADDPEGAFMRGFGLVAARNSEAYGLIGERAFADFDKAVRFNYADEHLWYRQQGWEHPVTILPWFRRFYFDGVMAGRFEFGFLVMDETERYVFEETHATPYDPSVLARYIEAIPVRVHVGDDRVLACRIHEIGRILAEAYVIATTGHKALQSFPVEETVPLFTSVGPAIVQLRSTRFGPVSLGRDSRTVTLSDGREIFVTSSDGATRRNTVIVQPSHKEALHETAEERAVRVLFSHLNALIYALSHYIAHEDKGLKDHLSRAELRSGIDHMIDRMSRFIASAPMTHDDEAFGSALAAFAKTYAGRTHELFNQLDDLAKLAHEATTVEKIRAYAKSLFEMGLMQAVDTVTSAAVKSGG